MPPFKETARDGERRCSNPIDSQIYQTLHEYDRSYIPLLVIGVFADDTRMSRNGAQSMNFVRMIVLNVWIHSYTWHDIGISPSRAPIPGASSAKPAEQRALLFQQYMFLLMKECIIASKGVYVLEGFFTRCVLFLWLVISHKSESSNHSKKRLLPGLHILLATI